MSLADRLKDLITPEIKDLSKGSRDAIIVSICSQKGGVGKTTTAVNLGTALAKFHNKKVLVCDLDPQGHVEKSLGAIIPDGVEYTPLSRILAAKKGNVLDSVIKTQLPHFDLTPGDKALVETESILAAKIGKEFILSRALESARSLYDFIIFDCPPSLGNLTINALCASNYAVVPCEMSVLAFEGVSDLLETVELVNERLNKELKILGVLFTRVDGRNITMNDVIENNMKKYFNGRIFKSQVAVNTAINKAQLDGRPVFDFDPSSTGSQNYQALADEILTRVKKNGHSSEHDR